MILSRSMVFSDGSGADRFLQWVKSHADGLFGLTTEIRGLAVQGRTGWMFTAPQCACPGAQPRVIGIVRDGSRIDWLTINGPQATSDRLRAVLAAPTSND